RPRDSTRGRPSRRRTIYRRQSIAGRAGEADWQLSVLGRGLAPASLKAKLRQQAGSYKRTQPPEPVANNLDPPQTSKASPNPGPSSRTVVLPLIPLTCS